MLGVSLWYNVGRLSLLDLDRWIWKKVLLKIQIISSFNVVGSHTIPMTRAHTKLIQVFKAYGDRVAVTHTDSLRSGTETIFCHCKGGHSSTPTSQSQRQQEEPRSKGSSPTGCLEKLGAFWTRKSEKSKVVLDIDGTVLENIFIRLQSLSVHHTTAPNASKPCLPSAFLQELSIWGHMPQAWWK